MLRELDKDEHVKYELWSSYVEQMTAAAEAQDKPVKHWTYFEWLDFYGLS